MMCPSAFTEMKTSSRPISVLFTVSAVAFYRCQKNFLFVAMLVEIKLSVIDTTDGLPDFMS